MGRDRQLEEFDAKDLGDDIRESGAAQVVRPRRSRTTSINLDSELIEELRAKGKKRGIGYQTMLKIIVREQLHKY